MKLENSHKLIQTHDHEIDILNLNLGLTFWEYIKIEYQIYIHLSQMYYKNLSLQMFNLIQGFTTKVYNEINEFLMFSKYLKVKNVTALMDRVFR